MRIRILKPAMAVLVLCIAAAAIVYAAVSQDAVSVTPYADTTVSLGYVKSVTIHPGGKSVRVALNDTTTADTDGYWVISSSNEPLELPLWQTTTLKLRGDTTSDTVTVRILIQKQ